MLLKSIHQIDKRTRFFVVSFFLTVSPGGQKLLKRLKYVLMVKSVI